MPTITDPTDPAIDRWLRSIEPRIELALRYFERLGEDAAVAALKQARRVEALQ